MQRYWLMMACVSTGKLMTEYEKTQHQLNIYKHYRYIDG